MSLSQPPSQAQVGKLINLIPVGLKEAGLDSPTFRATTIHFAEQVETVEKWLEEYAKSASKVAAEATTLESALNNFMSHSVLPTTISEAVVDHDYAVLAMKRYGEGAKDFWLSTVSAMKRLNSMIIDPIRSFIMNDIRAFKEIRRTLDLNQKQYDTLQAKYSSQAKTKEQSSLREDAFQLHEAKKAYLKSSMDFCLLAPQLRNTLDKLLVKIYFDQWREMRVSRDNATATFGKAAQDMERVKGWTRELENSDKVFRRELVAARKQIEETVEVASRPSRELDDYAASTVPYLGGGTPSTAHLKSLQNASPAKSEKQGWLNLRTYTGKPTRTVWVRRWAFVKNGIFGWLVQGSRSGGVEETERIGVLLCNVRPAFQEERRFCFEIKTTKTAMMLQADTQADLTEWIAVFEAAKRHALEHPASTDILSARSGNKDPAFAISQPPAPEFAALLSDATVPGGNDEQSLERSSTLPVPGQDGAYEGGGSTPRRSTVLDRDSDTGRENSRDHASRIIQKLDLHRKSTAGSALSGSPSTPSSGGIASLIAASHGSMPVGPGVPIKPPEAEPAKPQRTFTLPLRDMPPNTLAPSTLINPPAPTNLSKTAVVVSGERGIGVGTADTTGGMPSGMMANLWGSSNWGYVNRLERGEVKPFQESKTLETACPAVIPSRSPPKSPGLSALSTLREVSGPAAASEADLPIGKSREPSPRREHRSTLSLDEDAAKLQRPTLAPLQFPNYYPLQLKTQDAQFRLLFPNVKADEKLVLVFRATWNPNDQQEFPGRAYVTTKDIYFYSHHMGLVLTSGVSLVSISEVTAAPGRDCDFIFLHMSEFKDDSSTKRITIKTFLEPLKLLQRRLNFLVRNANADEPLELEEVIKRLIRMESDDLQRSPSTESWEDVSLNTPADDGTAIGRRGSFRSVTDLKAPIRVDRTLESHSGKFGYGRETSKFKLPAQPVEYVPSGNLKLATEKQVDISPKAMFHVLFGDKSAVWQLLQHERRAQNIKQGPWLHPEHGHLRRDLEYEVETSDWFGRRSTTHVEDYQIVDVMNDHLCYVVTDKRTAWHLPYRRYFRLVSKIVITHVAKSKCKLAIFTKVEWIRSPPVLKGVINQQAMNDLELDALDLADLAGDQVRKLGAHSRTKKAIHIYGAVGQQTQMTQFEVGDAILSTETRRIPVKRTLTQLLTESYLSFLQSAMSSLIMGIFNLLRWIWKTCTANSVIMALLILSVLFNSFHTYRDTFAWYHERNAGKFMARLGIKPSTVMSRAIYVRDMEDAMDTIAPVSIHNATSSCYAAFHSTNVLDDLAAPLSAPIGSDELVSRSSTRRLQRTRQRLGGYRHDLLVAMRVINSIEKEVLQTEWESWLTHENRRCRQVEAVLDSAKNGTSDAAKQAVNVGGSLGGRVEDVERWFGDYCLSCRRDREALLDR